MNIGNKSTAEDGKTGAGWGSRHPAMLMFVLLVIVLSILFWKDFIPSYVVFSNDGPLGGLVAEQNTMPSVMGGLWANLNWLGNESLAQPPAVSSTFRAIVSPLAYAKMLCPFSLLIAGLGAAFYFRQLKFAPIACLLGGIAAALNSDFFSTAAWGVSTQVIGFGAMYVALGFLADPSDKRRWVKVALAGMAVGVGVMEAYDIGALFSVTVAAFAVYQALFLTPRLTSPVQKFGFAILRAGLVAVFAAFIATHALTGLVGTQIKGVKAAEQTEEARQAFWQQATQWSVPAQEILQVTIPGIFGFRDDWYMYENDRPTKDQYWGEIGSGPGLARQTGTGYYAGVLVVVIALWAIFQSFRRRSPFTEVQRKAIWFWSVALVLSALLSFGKHAPLYQFFYAIPYASTIRNPAKFMHIFSWVLVIIFGYGTHGLWVNFMQNPLTKIEGVWTQYKLWRSRAVAFDRKWMTGCVLAIGVSVLAWLVYGAKNVQLAEYLKTVSIPPELALGVAQYSLMAVGWFILFLILTTVMLGLIFSGQFSGKRACVGGVLLGLILVVDLGRADMPWISYWDTDSKYAIDPIIKFLADKPYEHRVAMLPPQENTMQTALLQNEYFVDWKQHIFPYQNIQCSEVVQEPRVASDKDRFMMEGLAQGRNLPRFWELSNTRYLLGSADFVHKADPSGAQLKILQTFSLVPKKEVTHTSVSPEDFWAQPNPNGELAVIEYEAALPRAMLYTKWQTITNDDVTLQNIGSQTWNPHESVMVAENIPAPSGTNQDAGTVEINPNYKSKRIELSADIKSPCVLMLSERYNPKWQVEVDGKPAQLLRCDFILRGVYLQPGKHDIVFRFVNSHTTLYVTLAAIVLGLGLWGFLMFDERKQKTKQAA